MIMTRTIQVNWVKRLTIFVVLLFCSMNLVFAQATTPAPAANLHELRDSLDNREGRICAFKLEGTVLAADTESGTLLFQDESGVEVLEMNLQKLKVESGEKIRIQGTNYVSLTDFGLSLGTRPVIDLDNRHATIQRAGVIYLKAGQHRIHVDWFNHTAAAFLEVAYSGPHLPKQVIPDAALSRIEQKSTNGDQRISQGLTYLCFEGKWNKLPKFDTITSKKIGTTSNFNIDVRANVESVGLQFSGFLEVAEDGDYTFYLSSDDGSQLFLETTPPEISILGTNAVPKPLQINAGQLLASGPSRLWAEVEGTVVFLSKNGDGMQLELASGENRMQVEVINAPDETPWYLMHSRVRIRGICPDTRNNQGQKQAGTIVTANWGGVLVSEIAREYWSAFKQTSIDELNRKTGTENNRIARLCGRIHESRDKQSLWLEDTTGTVQIAPLVSPGILAGKEVECVGRWRKVGTNLIFYSAVARALTKAFDEASNQLRTLTTALQVQELKREEADREYPVEIQGVVIWVSSDFQSFVIQDNNRAVFVGTRHELMPRIPHPGDYCKITGVTRAGDFSPVVLLNDISVLGRGVMPLPILPARDQLLSGNLDAQYIEIRGLITSMRNERLTMVSTLGMIEVEILSGPAEPLENFLHSVVRIRGCCFPKWDKNTHHASLNEPVGLNMAAFSVDVPPPIETFQADKVRPKDFMQFDARFDALRRVRVSGQIIHCGPDLFYMMDDSTGLRLEFAEPQLFEAGDQIEAVGLVDLSGIAPVLRQAMGKRTGHSPLPQPRKLAINSLTSEYDSTLVSMEGILVDHRQRGAEHILELQVGVRNFLARLKTEPSLALDWPVGSRLKLTGVFHALDGNRLSGQEVNSFELLPNSPADIQLLAQPPWWTLGRLLVIVAILLMGLALTFFWISSLRRQVERRTTQLRQQIIERERAERQCAIEQERSRIAQDLHDEFGSELTCISMLATTSFNKVHEPNFAIKRLDEIEQISRTMVSALDGLVWVINARNDSLKSLVEYLASYTEEFVGKANVACRIIMPTNYSDRIISAETRHDVLLSVREALNNAVRHGKPNEVLLEFRISHQELEIRLADDGCGFEPGKTKGNGLNNLRQRMAKWDGGCNIESCVGKGTVVVLKLPFPG